VEKFYKQKLGNKPVREEKFMSKNSKNSRTSRLLRIVLTAVFITGAIAAISQAAPITITNATECVQDDVQIKCEEKNIVTVPVSFGLEQYLDVAFIGTGEGHPLEETLRFEITKSAPKLTYPLRYFHTVAYAPHEEVRKVPHFISGCPECTACADENSPTCGWTLDSSGARIPYSQGFCSIKSLEELEHGGCSLWRGEEFFGQANIDNPFSTGHALRLGSVYFEGYEIGEYLKSCEIAVKIYKGTTLLHQFTISPNKPYFYLPQAASSLSSLIKAALVGDMDAYEGATELDNYILYIPVSPPDHPFVQNYQNNMLLVPREEVSKDGGEPDKVGVSFHTFRLLGSDCKVSEAGDGLGNQLYNKHNSDLAKLTMNPEADTTYLVSGKKAFKGSITPDRPKVLTRTIGQINNSLVTLTVDPAQISIIENEAVGYIKEAYVKTFTAMSNDGVLAVVIGNVGEIRANYIVSVSDATANILSSIPAQARTLNPNEEATLYFDVSTVQNLDASHKVTVTLRTSTGRQIDSVDVLFDTLKHSTEYSYNLRQKNKDSKFVFPDDNSPPVITLNGPNTITLECGVDSYAELGAEAVDDIDPNIEVAISGTVDTSTCGTYSVIYSAKDSSCNTAKAVRVVEVVDTIAPVITLNGPAEVVLGCGTDTYTEQGATATDNCDNAVAVVISGSVADGVITYNATDSSGNTATAVRVVKVRDTIAPVITLNGPAKVVLGCGTDTYTEQGATATDNCDNAVAVVIGGSVADGVITYNATDSSGNAAAQVTRTIVTGEDTIAPQFELAVEPDILWPPNSKMVLVKPTWTVSDKCDKSPEVTLVSITSNEDGNRHKCKGPKDKDKNITIGDDGSIYLRAECNSKGGNRIYTITYQAADDAGNVTVKTVTVAVPCGPRYR